MRPHPAAGKFVDLIYGAMWAKTSWCDLLEEVCGLVPNGRAMFSFRDAAAGTGAICVSAGMADDAVTAYASHYCRINPWAAAGARLPLGRVVQGDELVDRRTLRRTEFYTDFLKPQGLADAIGLIVRRDGRFNFGFGLLCADVSADEAAQARRCLAVLAPHLQWAFLRVRSFRDPAARAFAGEGGQLRVGAGGKVVEADRAAIALTEAGGPLRIDAAGRLRCGGAVEAAVEQAIAGWGSREPFVHTSHIPRGGELPLRATIWRQGMDEHSFFRGPECLVLVEDPGSELRAAVEKFGDLHGLTGAQRRAVMGLVEGFSPREIAAAAGTSPGTVRLQIKQVFQRTGLNRQVDLVRHVAALAVGPASPIVDDAVRRRRGVEASTPRRRER